MTIIFLIFQGLRKKLALRLSTKIGLLCYDRLVSVLMMELLYLIPEDRLFYSFDSEFIGEESRLSFVDSNDELLLERS